MAPRPTSTELRSKTSRLYGVYSLIALYNSLDVRSLPGWLIDRLTPLITTQYIILIRGLVMSSDYRYFPMSSVTKPGSLVKKWTATSSLCSRSSLSMPISRPAP